MESMIVKSWRHHKARLERAVDARDHSAMRDASGVVRDLEARMLPAEKLSVGLARA